MIEIMCRPAGAWGVRDCFPGVSTPGYFIQPLWGWGFCAGDFSGFRFAYPELFGFDPAGRGENHEYKETGIQEYMLAGHGVTMGSHGGLPLQ